MKTTDEPIVVEQTFNKPIESVWNAITQIDQMRQWYFDNIPEFKPEVGFETQFNIKSQDRNFLHNWKVTTVEPLKKIAYDWTFDGYPGESTTLFELSEQGDVTKLRLTATARESFPQDIPEFKRESGVAGWDYFIKKSLKEYLEKS